MLQAAQVLGFNRSVTVLCEEAGVSRTCFYEWMRDDKEFQNAWREIPLRILQHQLPGIRSAMTKKAQEGDVSAARLIEDITGAITKKLELSGQLGLIDVINEAERQRNADDEEPEPVTK